VVGFLLENKCHIQQGTLLSMEKIISKFKMLSIKEQVFLAFISFILALIILPNTLVYAISALTSYKVIERKPSKYTVTTIFAVITFFSGILWIADDTPIATSLDNADIEQSELVTVESEIAKTDANATSTSTNTASESEPIAEQTTFVDQTGTKGELYEVVKVVDGDTLDVMIDGKAERLRLIGINTPETVDPRKPVECFGAEASNKAKALLSGKKISLESDSSQGERDKYDRLLRYVFLEDGTNFNLLMIREGYAYEYTYNLPYKYQSEFKDAQKEASVNKIGLWGNTCETPPAQTANVVSTPTQSDTANSCTIKGNISSSGEKIFHTVGCGSYSKTVIDESAGEKWFCTEQEAIDAGWRKALNCN
jgi:micrococcal nuclease